MAKKTFSNKFKSGSLKKVAEKHNAQLNTQNLINQAEIKPNKENISNAVKAINEDKILTPIQKKELLQQFEDRYIKQFENCPEAYIDLKIEAKFLSKMTVNSFIFLADRLKIIRDNELYKEDNYKNFNEFIKNELEIERSTVYRYLNIIDVFGVDTCQHLPSVRGLFPFMPLFNQIKDKNKIGELKEVAINAVQNNSARKAEEIARKLKIDYGVNNTQSKSGKFLRLEKSVLTLNYDELKRLQQVINLRLNEMNEK